MSHPIRPTFVSEVRTKAMERIAESLNCCLVLRVADIRAHIVSNGGKALSYCNVLVFGRGQLVEEALNILRGEASDGHESARFSG